MHHHADARNALKLGAQFGDDLRRDQRPLIARLQLDAEGAGIQSAARSTGTHRSHKALNIRIVRDDLRRFRLMPLHFRKRDAIRTVGKCLDLSGVFGREKVLRHDLEQLDRSHNAAEEQHKDQLLVPHGPAE